MEAASTDGRTRRRIDNRTRIYEAAMRLLRRSSYGQLTVEEICEEAGVGRATFFRIFESKAGLLREFNRRLTRRVEERLVDEAPAGVACELRIVVDEITAAWSQAGPGAAEMAMDFIAMSQLSDPHAAHPELLQLVIDVVARGIESGELHDTHPPDLAGALALMQIVGPVGYWIQHRRESLEELANGALDIWLNGAARRPE